MNVGRDKKPIMEIRRDREMQFTTEDLKGSKACRAVSRMITFARADLKGKDRAHTVMHRCAEA
jgi:hypothetical protein